MELVEFVVNFISSQLAKSGKLGRLLVLGSCAAPGVAFAFMGF